MTAHVHAPAFAPLAPTPAWTRPRGLLARLVRTDADAGPLVARVVLGAVMFPHGAQKVLGWFGGAGLEATMDGFTTKLGIPAPLAALAIAAEFLGAIGLVLGAFSRVAAFGVASVMAVAAVLVHAKTGFFMNWFGTQAGEGIEYHLLALGLALVVMWKGAGAFSLDRMLTRRLTR
jgi:putative oxidoreductase